MRFWAFPASLALVTTGLVWTAAAAPGDLPHPAMSPHKPMAAANTMDQKQPAGGTSTDKGGKPPTGTTTDKGGMKHPTTTTPDKQPASGKRQPAAPSGKSKGHTTP